MAAKKGKGKADAPSCSREAAGRRKSQKCKNWCVINFTATTKLSWWGSEEAKKFLPTAVRIFTRHKTRVQAVQKEDHPLNWEWRNGREDRQTNVIRGRGREEDEPWQFPSCIKGPGVLADANL